MIYTSVGLYNNAVLLCSNIILVLILFLLNYLVSSPSSPFSAHFLPFLGSLSSGNTSPNCSSPHSSYEQLQQQQIIIERTKSKSLPGRSKHVPSSTMDHLLSPVPKSPTILLPSNDYDHQDSNCSSSEINDLHGSYSNRISPRALARHIFHLPNLRNSLSPHSSPRSSPRSSPLLGRKKFRGLRRLSACDGRESDFLHWWMEDVGEGETNHWRQVLERQGEWVYYWHCIRYRLRATYSC